VRWTVPILLLLGLVRVAAAHQSSVAYVAISETPEGAELAVRVSTRDLYEALGLDKERDATDEEITTGADRLDRYVRERIKLTASGGAACSVEGRGVSVMSQGDRFVELRWLARCPGDKMIIDYSLFLDLDPRHTGMIQLRRGATVLTHELSKGFQHLELPVGAGTGGAGLGAGHYIVKGVEHIFTGYDHIAFLVGLLLVVVLRRREGVWEVRGVRAAAPYTLKVVTAFTLAHSLTLILAALDVVSIPSRLVESAIAASIVYVAIENITTGDPQHRWPLAFLFGLIHGLGFASMLRPLLPPSGVVVPLLLFNVGVELGQVAIVLVLFPILHGLAKLSVSRYRRVVLLGGSAAIGVLGVLWLIERIADVELISRWL
jgi:hypothetical protein